jgi:hypothetical protein
MNRKYKVYFYDKDVKQSYPVTIWKKDISDLCSWLNSHTRRWNLEVLSAQLLDRNDNFLARVELLPTEITNQHFIVPIPQRMIAHYEFMYGGV